MEVMAATVLLTLCVGSLFTICGNSLVWNRQAADRTSSLLLAADAIEQLKCHSELVKPVDDLSAADLGLSIGPRDEYSIRVSIREYDPSLGLYIVNVNSSWNRGGRLRQQSLTGLIPGKS